MAKRITVADGKLLLSKFTLATATDVTAAVNTALADATVTCGTHGLVAGDLIAIYGVAGSTYLNGVWYVKSVSSATVIKITATQGGTALQGDASTYTSGGKVRRITCGLTPGDLQDVQALLDKRPNEVLADNNRAAERSIKTILGY